MKCRHHILLYLFRKICKNCKCKLEDHDVQLDDDDVHRVILKGVVKDKDGKTAFQRSKETFSQLLSDPQTREDAKSNFTVMPKAATGSAVSTCIYYCIPLSDVTCVSK